MRLPPYSKLEELMYFDLVLGNALETSVEIEVLLWGELAPEKVELRADSD